MALPKTPPAAKPPAPILGDGFSSLHHQLHLLVRETRDWATTNSLQILIALAAGIAVTAGLWGLRTLGTRLCREGRGGHWRQIIGHMVARTSFWFCLIVAIKLVDGYADAPPAVHRTVNFIFTIIFTLQATVWARELVLGLIEHRAGAGDHPEANGLNSALGIIRLLVSFALFAIAAVLVLDNLGVNVTGLVAGLGIGGIAIGLAAQGIFADLFAALAIIFDRPFRRGDSISWSSTSGSVEAIGLKSTRVRAVSGEEVVIANRKLLDNEIHNFARLDRRRSIVDLAVNYQTPADVVATLPDVIGEIVEAEKNCALVRCGLTGFGVGGILVEVQFDVRTQSYDELFAARSKVCLAITERFAELGVAFVNSAPK